MPLFQINGNHCYHFILATNDWLGTSLGMSTPGILTHLQYLLGPAPEAANSNSNKDSAMQCVNAKEDNYRGRAAQRKSQLIQSVNIYWGWGSRPRNTMINKNAESLTSRNLYSGGGSPNNTDISRRHVLCRR